MQNKIKTVILDNSNKYEHILRMDNIRWPKMIYQCPLHCKKWKDVTIIEESSNEEAETWKKIRL